MKSFNHPVLAALFACSVICSPQAEAASVFPTACMEFFKTELDTHNLYPKANPKAKAEVLDHQLRYSTNGHLLELAQTQDKKGFVITEVESGATTKLELNSKCELVKVLSPSGKTYKKPECERYVADLRSKVENSKQIVDLEKERQSVSSEDQGEYRSEIQTLQLENTDFVAKIKSFEAGYFEKAPSASVINRPVRMCSLSIQWGSRDQGSSSEQDSASGTAR